MKHVVRIASAVPSVQVGNVAYNTKQIIRMLQQAKQQGASIVNFPELCLSGYTCGDLFFQRSLLEACRQALAEIVPYTKGLFTAVGTPLLIEGQLYNCAVAMANGVMAGVTVKTFIPNYNEYYEKRWFSSAEQLTVSSLSLHDATVPVGSQIVYQTADGLGIGIEICEDLWTAIPPSSTMALGGAHFILNASASNETVAKNEYRRQLCSQQSARGLCVYMYTSAGPGESSSDLIFSGNSLMYANGRLLAANEQFIQDDYCLTADVTVDDLQFDRMHNKSFHDCGHATWCSEVTTVAVDFTLAESDGSVLQVEKLPFVPSSKEKRLERCKQIFDMQAYALARRLKVTGGRLVVGISGGLDSTLALLAAVRSMELLQLPASNIVGITMPCFGTTDETYQNAWALMKALGIDAREIPIADAVRRHFADIGHRQDDYSVTYENAQARERTQVLMDVANQENAIVLGTGDLSEIALGWCTFNADHMSMYGVNSGIPKTLIRWIIQVVAEQNLFPGAKEVLLRVLDTPISPELLPPDAAGNIAQKTEDLVGPYALHDFFLYHMVRYGREPAQILALAEKAFQNDFDRATILKWLRVFYRRFFNQQFKRNCIPDGVKIGSICLSPRGDWRMPSDASAAHWLSCLPEDESSR